MMIFVYDSGISKKYTVQTPFPEGYDNAKVLNWFKDNIFNLYDTCSIGTITVFYDWELTKTNDE